MATQCAFAQSAEIVCNAVNVSDRRSARGEVVCRAGKFGLGRPIIGKLVDLSQDGAGFVLAQQLGVNDEIELELTPIGGRRLETRHAVIRWVRQLPDGAWRLGCQFERRLSYQEFTSFVR